MLYLIYNDETKEFWLSDINPDTYHQRWKAERACEFYNHLKTRSADPTPVYRVVDIDIHKIAEESKNG